MIMDSSTFYRNRFPKLANLLKEKLAKESNINHSLDVKEYLVYFLEFYEENNAFTFFKNDNITKDIMIVSIFINKLNKEVSFRREIHIEDCDEEFQINFQLLLDLPTIMNDIIYFFEIERDMFDDFRNTELGSFYLSDFENMILSSQEMEKIANNIPVSHSIDLNADF
jgi:hypothetical protein